MLSMLTAHFNLIFLMKRVLFQFDESRQINLNLIIVLDLSVLQL